MASAGQLLAERAIIQARRLGAELLSQRAVGLRTENNYNIVQLGDGGEVSCHACLISVGVNYRRLDIPGVERLTGAGVYYGAAVTEAATCKDESVYIVGGANSAGQAAMYFSKYAKKVTMLVRGESLKSSMSKYLIDQIAAHIEYRGQIALRGHGSAGGYPIGVFTPLRAAGVKKTWRRVACSSLIGAAPKTDWLPQTIMRDANGFLLSGPDLKVDGKNGKELEPDPRSVPPGDQCPGSVRRRRRASWFRKASSLSRRRRVNLCAIHSPVPGAVLRCTNNP